ncbi:hypothetical protein [Actinoplanes sp. GCM10030250]|uniref:hypothetical protein n=1 Tax=Actinoplanes sp. GCM10030250 TaxID=3273376 RepID=UPI003605F3E1
MITNPHAAPAAGDEFGPLRFWRLSTPAPATLFLAPPITEESSSAPSSDCGEVAMHRLRHPFTIAAV